MKMVWRCFFLMMTIFTTSYGDNNSTDINSLASDNLVKALDDFGYRIMLSLMKQDAGANVVLSPTGIAGLLAITLLGTVGKTYDELAEALGFSQDILLNKKKHEELGMRLRSLDSSNTTQTKYADAVFVDERIQLRNMYQSYISRVYGAEVSSVDFQRSPEVREIINKWVSNHTNNQIDNFLKQDLPPFTRVVLVSALYFRGQWKQPFLPEHTLKMPFKKSDGEVMSDMMLNFGKFKHVYEHKLDLQMIALPYNDSVTTMYVLKPQEAKRQSLPELLERINYEKINDLINSMTEEDCVVRFPKMNLQSNVNLESSLKKMGIQSMFIPGQANFALMVNTSDVDKTENEKDSRSLKEMVDRLSNPGLHVDSVVHDVKITVNEYGTEAVAATAALISRTAKLFYADSPFYMFIRNEDTKLVTFSALVLDPTLV